MIIGKRKTPGNLVHLLWKHLVCVYKFLNKLSFHFNCVYFKMKSSLLDGFKYGLMQKSIYALEYHKTEYESLNKEFACV